MEIQILIDTLYFYSLEYSQRDISSDHKKNKYDFIKNKRQRDLYLNHKKN